MVVRRYIDFLILLIPTPHVSVLFCSSIPTFLLIFLMFFFFHSIYIGLCYNIMVYSILYIYGYVIILWYILYIYIWLCYNILVYFTYIYIGLCYNIMVYSI